MTVLLWSSLFYLFKSTQNAWGQIMVYFLKLFWTVSYTIRGDMKKIIVAKNLGSSIQTNTHEQITQYKIFMTIGQSMQHVIQLHWNHVIQLNLRNLTMTNKCSILTNAKMMKLHISKLMWTWLAVYHIPI